MTDAEYEELLNRMPRFTNPAPDAAPAIPMSGVTTGTGTARVGTRGETSWCNSSKGHCWHGTGRMSVDKRPLYPQYCCHCDARRETEGPFDRNEGHGPYSRYREYKGHFDVPEQK